jgi:PAS domain S-box-containing protein
MDHGSNAQHKPPCPEADEVDRLRAEAVESDRRLRTLVANLPGVVYRCANDRNWTMEYLSEGVETLTGHAVDDFVLNSELSFNDIIHPDDRARVWDTIQDALSRREPWAITYRVLHTDGTEHVVREHGRGVFRNGASEPETLEGFLADITQETVAQEELHAALAEMRTAVERLRIQADRMPLAYIAWDRDFRVTEWNPAAEHMFGYTAEEALGHDAYELIVPADLRPLIVHLWADIMRGGTMARYSLNENVHKDGHRIVGEWFNTPMRDHETGEVTGCLSMVHDATLRMEQEEEIQASERRMRAIFDAVNDGIVVQDAETGMILECNRRACEIYGFPPEQMRKLSLAHLCAGGEYSAENAAPHIRKALEEGSAVFEWHAKDKAGRLFWVEVSLQPMTVGGATRLIAAVRDITEHRQEREELEAYRRDLEAAVSDRTEQLHRVNEELTTANDRLEVAFEELQISNEEKELVNRELRAASRAKSEFLANMSHELRTPLNSIIGFTGIMLSGAAGELTDEQRRQLTMVATAGEHLLGLINDVLDLSKVEAGRVELELTDVDAIEPVAHAVGTLRPLAEQKGLELTSSVDPGVRVRVDRRRLEQILINLVGNAVKFTDEGSVRVDVTSPEPGVVAFAVSDTGRGIAADDLDLIFQEFYQVAGDDRASRTGTGLGLALSARLAGMLGGHIEVTSELGTGSTFKLVVPGGTGHRVAAA